MYINKQQICISISRLIETNPLAIHKFVQKQQKNEFFIHPEKKSRQQN